MNINFGFTIDIDSEMNEAEQGLFEELIFETINKHCIDFDLSLLKKIVLVMTLPPYSDGRCYKTYIEINGMLIKKLTSEKYVESRDKTRQTLISTIYHELCHTDTRTIMPNLYEIIDFEDEQNEIFMWRITTHFWVEYVTHIKYEFLTEVGIATAFCDRFLKSDWSKIENQYFSMIKELPYFISRWESLHPNDFLESLSTYPNSFTTKHIVATYKICLRLIEHYPFDCCQKLEPLYVLFNENAEKFYQIRKEHLRQVLST